MGRAWKQGFLGHQGSRANVSVDPRKVAAVRNWPSFDALKCCLTTAPVLHTFDPASRRAMLTMDASETAISALLTQPNDKGQHHSVAYKSRKFTAAEQAYLPHVLELVAVVHALRVFRHCLLGSGAPRPPGVPVLSVFTLRTDNQAVSWLHTVTKRDINCIMAHWLDEIKH